MLEVDIVCGTYQTCKKKPRRYKNEQNFLSFLVLCQYVCQLKIVSLSKLSHQICQKNLFFFECISVVISQKLAAVDQFNIGPFFPRTVGKNCKDVDYFCVTYPLPVSINRWVKEWPIRGCAMMIIRQHFKKKRVYLLYSKYVRQTHKIIISFI